LERLTIELYILYRLEASISIARTTSSFETHASESCEWKKLYLRLDELQNLSWCPCGLSHAEAAVEAGRTRFGDMQDVMRRTTFFDAEEGVTPLLALEIRYLF